MNAITSLPVRPLPLAEIARALAEPRKSLERTFLEMGDSLSVCARLLGDIAAAYEGMPEALASGGFLAAADDLAAVRTEVADLAAGQANEAAHFGRLVALAATVTKPLAELRKAVRAIRLIAVNARIVAAGLTEGSSDFSVFTTDMQALGENVEHAVAAFAEAYDRLQAKLAMAQAANDAFRRSHGGTLSEISTRLDEQRRIAETHRRQATVQAAEHCALTDAIRSRIATAISALQIGDITRQRVEHAEEALDLLQSHLAQSGSDEGGATEAIVCRLQAAQLDEALYDFEGQADELTRSLRQLAEDAAAVQDGASETNASLAAGGTALGILVRDLRHIGALFADFGCMGAEVEDAAKDLTGAVAQMVDHLEAIRRIEQQIRMLSLNTAIQCDKLGPEGRPLRVIAQDLRALAGQTVNAASAIMTGLEQTSAEAGRLSENHASNRTETMAALERKSEQAACAFERVVAQLNDHVTVLAQSVPLVVARLQEATDRVACYDTMARPWRQAGHELARTGAEAAASKAAGDLALLDILRGRYTMDSERRLHDRQLGLPEMAAANGPAPSDDEFELSDIFF